MITLFNKAKNIAIIIGESEDDKKTIEFLHKYKVVFGLWKTWTPGGLVVPEEVTMIQKLFPQIKTTIIAWINNVDNNFVK